MALIDGLEGAARGVYSGCVGFISVNDCFDLNVVIRTAVIDPHAPGPSLANGAANGGGGQEEREQQAEGAAPADGKEGQGGDAPLEESEGLERALLSIGAGGAIVVQSDLEGEFQEMRLKARALLAAIGRCDAGGDGGSGPAVLDDQVPWKEG